MYETTDEICCVRVSPRGDLVAFLEQYSNGGFVAVADRGGKARRLSGPWANAGILAWRPDARSLVFHAISSATKQELREVTLAGKEHILYPFSGVVLLLHDLLPDGRLLVERAVGRDGIVMRAPDDEREREMPGVGGPHHPLLSADGSTLVFTDRGGVYLRRVGAESAIRLGDGSGQSLSPDGKWVLASISRPPNRLVLLPTGAGAARTIALPGLTTISSGEILPDGRTLLVAASEPGKPIGLWTAPLEGGKPRLVLPEVTTGGMAPSLDGKQLAVHTGGAQGFIQPLDGGPRTPLRGLEAGDRLDQWSGDGRYLFASRPQELPGKIFRIEVESGRRELWKELMPPDPTGVIEVNDSAIAISRDGRGYAYSYRRTVVSDLYLLDGVR